MTFFYWTGGFTWRFTISVLVKTILRFSVCNLLLEAHNSLSIIVLFLARDIFLGGLVDGGREQNYYMMSGIKLILNVLLNMNIKF